MEQKKKKKEKKKKKKKKKNRLKYCVFGVQCISTEDVSPSFYN